MKLLRVFFSISALLLFAFLLALPGRASDATDYTVTVSAGVNPKTIYTGQSATGSATASITGNNPSANQELTKYNPTASFGILSVKGTKPNGKLPSATINPDSTNLTVTAVGGTTVDTYTVTIQATYIWKDSDGNAHSPFGTTTVGVTVLWPTVSITLGYDHVQSGKSITGVIALTIPTTLPNSFQVGLVALNTPPPSPQTTPPTPPATGMVTVPGGVMVPGNGTSVSFTVKGAAVSAFLGDVYITANSGATSNNASLTVWDIDSLVAKATPANAYDLATITDSQGNSASFLQPETSNGFELNNAGPCVNLKAYMTMKPATAPTAWLSPDYANAQIGMVQNILSGSVYKATYTNPQPVWNAGVLKGTVGYAWSSFQNAHTLPTCVDTALTTQNYPVPYDTLVPITSVWSSSDGPSYNGVYNQGLGSNSGTVVGKSALVDASGKAVGLVNYTLTNLIITASFSDWACMLNGTVTFGQTTGWTIGVGGEPPAPNPTTGIALATLGQTATIGGGGGTPITSGTTANQYVRGPYDNDQPASRVSFTR